MSQIKLITLVQTVTESNGVSGYPHEVSLPALNFDLPLPLTSDTEVIRRRHSGLWNKIWAKLRHDIPWNVAVGYEDELGFHYGPAPKGAATVFKLTK